MGRDLICLNFLVMTGYKSHRQGCKLQLCCYITYILPLTLGKLINYSELLCLHL